MYIANDKLENVRFINVQVYLYMKNFNGIFPDEALSIEVHQSC